MNIAIDIGGVLGTKNNTDKLVEEIPGAFECVRKISERYRVFIISAVKNQAVLEKTLKWLSDTRFYERTGVKKENLFFVSSIDEKANKAKELNIEIMIDDSYKVLSRTSSYGIKGICLSEKYKKENKRYGILVRRWDDVMKVIEDYAKGGL